MEKESIYKEGSGSRFIPLLAVLLGLAAIVLSFMPFLHYNEYYDSNNSLTGAIKGIQLIFGTDDAIFNGRFLGNTLPELDYHFTLKPVISNLMSFILLIVGIIIAFYLTQIKPGTKDNTLLALLGAICYVFSGVMLLFTKKSFLLQISADDYIYFPEYYTYEIYLFITAFVSVIAGVLCLACIPSKKKPKEAK